MGLIAATINKQYLIAYKNELEYKMSLISQAKMGLSDSVTDLMNAGTDMDPENPAVKQLEQRRERLNLLEKKLDMQMDEYQTKLKMIEKNIEACDKMIEGSIK
jgi:capsule polysaccharide export protein KpsE/RkpR